MPRRGIGLVVPVAAAAACVSAAAAISSDWSVALGRPTTPPRAMKPFAMLVQLGPADENVDSYTAQVTLTPSKAALRVVSWSSTAGIRCTRSGRAVVCTQRSIGGAAPFNQLSAVFVLRAAKAGIYSVNVKVVIAGDTDVTNDAAKRTFTVKPAKKR